MTSSAARWDERYRGAPAVAAPSDLLVRFSSLLPPGGRALDVACGAGRNAVYLAERGLEVVAVDRSREGLQQGRELARARQCRVLWVQAHLETFELPAQAFDVISCFYYRDPDLYPRLRSALRPQGLLFYETFTLDQLEFASGPRDPAHCSSAENCCASSATGRCSFTVRRRASAEPPRW